MQHPLNKAHPHTTVLGNVCLMHSVFVSSETPNRAHHDTIWQTAQIKEALAYGAYAATNTFLPNVVNAVTLFYGGELRSKLNDALQQ